MKNDSVTQDACRFRSILVIDDHPLYCQALTAALAHEFDGCSIRAATTLKSGLAEIGAQFSPDLVILDLKLPDVAGVSGFKAIRGRVPDVPILVISALSTDDVIQAVMDVGAAGFLPKDAPVRELKAALTEVRMGRKFLPKGFSPNRRTAETQQPAQQAAQRIAELTPQQARIMKLICAGKPNKVIAYELSLAEATVKAHITAMLRRLGVQNRTQAAVMMENASLEPGAGDADAKAFLSR